MRMKQTWLWLWTFYNSTSTHKVPSWVDSFTSSQKKSSESSTQKKSSTVLAEKQKPSLLQIWCAQNGWPTVICHRSPSNLNLCTPFYVVTTYQIVLNQYAEKKNEHEWLLKAVILKTESTFPLFYPFSISNGDIKKFFFNRNFVNSSKHFMREI